MPLVTHGARWTKTEDRERAEIPRSEKVFDWIVGLVGVFAVLAAAGLMASLVWFAFT